MLHQVASCIAFGSSASEAATVAKMAGRTVWRVAMIDDVAAMRVGENGGRHDDSTTYRLSTHVLLRPPSTWHR